MTAISRTAQADETRHSFDRHFYSTESFPFSKLSLAEGVRVVVHDRKAKSSKHVGVTTLVADLTSARGAQKVSLLVTS